MQHRVKHLEKNQFAEIFGWVASILILVAYALLSLNVINSNSIVYHMILLVGSIGLTVVTYRHRAFQSVTVNITFAVLSLIAIIRIIFFN